MTLFGIIWIAIILVGGLVFGAVMIFDRWCIHKEDMFRMKAQLEEIRYCYASEQSFMTLEDDPEHIDSISVPPRTISAEEKYGER